jgi:hypothetical protein
MENLCGRPANSFFIAINACRIRPNAVNPVRNSRTRGWRRSSTHRPRAKSAISRSRQSVLFARQSRPYRFIRHRAGRSIAGPASSNRLTAATVPEPDQPYPPTYTLGLISGSAFGLSQDLASDRGGVAFSNNDVPRRKHYRVSFAPTEIDVRFLALSVANVPRKCRGGVPHGRSLRPKPFLPSISTPTNSRSVARARGRPQTLPT